MTTATTTVRVAAASLVGALALTACSSGGGSDSKDGSSPTPSPTATAGTGGGSGGTAIAADALQGSWVTTAGGKLVALVINGKQAGLFATGGTVCSGTAGNEAGMQMIHLKCTGRNKERATGTVDSVSKTTLKVTWTGDLGKETYTRSEGGTIPSGFPTASLGS